MMSLTHAAIATSIVGFSLGTTDPLVMAMAIAGSQLPDLDTSTSSLGQILWPISRGIEERFPHRSITHSLIATAAIATLSYPLYLQFGLKPWLALWMGHLVTIFADTFTKQGVQLFWPNPVWCVFGSNPRRRLTTGGPGEYWVLAGAIALLAINLQLTNSGGIVQSASQSLGLRSGILDIYNETAPNRHVYAEIDGVFAIDSSEADGKYFIVAVEGTEFIVQSTDGRIFKTGNQIIVNRLTTSSGAAARTTVETITFDDEEALSKLQAFRRSDSAMFVSGQLAIDLPEDVAIAPDPLAYPTASISGSNITFTYCPLELVLNYLKDQYAVGTLSLKTISPAPEF